MYEWSLTNSSLNNFHEKSLLSSSLGSSIACVSIFWDFFYLHIHALSQHKIKYCSNVSTTPITAMGCWQYLPLSVVQLKGKHCMKLHCRKGVVYTGKSFSEPRNIWRTCCVPKLFWMSKQNKNNKLCAQHVLQVFWAYNFHEQWSICHHSVS